MTLALVVVAGGCMPQQAATVAPPAVAVNTPTAAPSETPAPSPTPVESTVASPCVLPTVVPPTPPPERPGYAHLDITTGLHVTGNPQEIDLGTYRLKVSGRVARPLSLSYDELRCMPKVEVHAELNCPGFFTDEATWAGARIQDVLALAGVQEGATGLRLISADGYQATVYTVALLDTSMLAYEWEGKPLPILHGFPVRAVLPGVTGGKWVKWLIEIEVY